MNNVQRCDCCSKFGELEEVTIVVKKHPQCDVNALFAQPVNHVVPLSPFSTSSIGTSAVIPNTNQIVTEIPPLSSREEEMAKILREGGTLSK